MYGLIALLGLIPVTAAGHCTGTSLGLACGKTETVLGTYIMSFHGIPYAQPPIGNLRFKPPKPSLRWEKEIDGTKITPSCPQYRPTDFESSSYIRQLYPQNDQSENCLHLNIYGPLNGRGLGVMFWIHGGSLTCGSSTVSLYDGRAMAAKSNVVVVTVNYRLGLLGFGYLGLPGMPGNMGLLDQRLALQWVRDHIHNFGGDPNKVTIFGESAGGASVAAHVIAPASQSLFTAAVTQSGSVFDGWAINSQEKALASTEKASAKFGCKGKPAALLDCLMKVPGKKLGDFDPFGPKFEVPAIMVDSDSNFFGKPVGTSIKEGNYSKKWYLIGTNADEANFMYPIMDPKVFSLKEPWSITRQQYEKYSAEIISAAQFDEKLIPKIIKFYDKPKKYGSYLNCLKNLDTDVAYFGSYILAKGLARTSNHVYWYHFNETSPASLFPTHMGATHMQEIPFVFGRPLLSGAYNDKERKLSSQMMDIWTGLANRDPKKINWPSMKPEEPITAKHLSTDGPEVIAEYKKEEFEFLERTLREDGDQTRVSSLWNSGPGFTQPLVALILTLLLHLL